MAIPRPLTTKLLDALPDPKEVGQSEYRMLYELLVDIGDTATTPDDDILRHMEEVLGEVGRWVANLRTQIRAVRANPRHVPMIRRPQ